jgi:GNAT superfamily N-acetyltransferase
MAATARQGRSPFQSIRKAETGDRDATPAHNSPVSTRITSRPLRSSVGNEEWQEEKHFMPDLRFRDAERSDLPQIIALLADDALGRQREIPGAIPAPCYLAALEAIAADANQQLVVAVEGDVVVGTLQITFIPGLSRQGAWRGQIESVRVASDRRGSGLGHRLFEWAIERCRARGCSLVQLTTDKSRPDAHRFYEQLGFESSHLGYKLSL